MAKGSGIAAAIIASILLSVAITGVAGYFLLPKFTAPAFEHGEWETQAIVYDNELTWADVPDTEVNITIKKNSRISCIYSSSYLIGLWGTLGSEQVKFFVALVVEGVGNKTTYVKYWDQSGVTNNIEIASSFSSHYVTDPLAKGTYRVYLTWRSVLDSTGTNYLIFNTPAANYTRCLSATEIL
ncbi:MAG: hypothetical protein EU530_07205 [Promethearchaeota archaeon]|nr:MAG: hypothetical protein EU530_07205 [Candidatus Lokiarchaeota archaeon]